MRIPTVKRAYQSVGNHAAVFVIRLRQQDDILRNAASSDHIAAAQIVLDKHLQIVHCGVQTAACKHFAVLAGDRQQADIR